MYFEHTHYIIYMYSSKSIFFFKEYIYSVGKLL